MHNGQGRWTADLTVRRIYLQQGRQHDEIKELQTALGRARQAADGTAEQTRNSLSDMASRSESARQEELANLHAVYKDQIRTSATDWHQVNLPSPPPFPKPLLAR